jgi:hypothetical protein
VLRTTQGRRKEEKAPGSQNTVEEQEGQRGKMDILLEGTVDLELVPFFGKLSLGRHPFPILRFCGLRVNVEPRHTCCTSALPGGKG